MGEKLFLVPMPSSLRFRGHLDRRCLMLHQVIILKQRTFPHPRTTENLSPRRLYQPMTRTSEISACVVCRVIASPGMILLSEGVLHRCFTVTAWQRERKLLYLRQNVVQEHALAKGQ